MKNGIGFVVVVVAMFVSATAVALPKAAQEQLDMVVQSHVQALHGAPVGSDMAGFFGSWVEECENLRRRVEEIGGRIGRGAEEAFNLCMDAKDKEEKAYKRASTAKNAAGRTSFSPAVSAGEAKAVDEPAIAESTDGALMTVSELTQVRPEQIAYADRTWFERLIGGDVENCRDCKVMTFRDYPPGYLVSVEINGEAAPIERSPAGAIVSQQALIAGLGQVFVSPARGQIFVFGIGGPPEVTVHLIRPGGLVMPPMLEESRSMTGTKRNPNGPHTATFVYNGH